jgi:hypothetical protein
MMREGAAATGGSAFAKAMADKSETWFATVAVDWAFRAAVAEPGSYGS